MTVNEICKFLDSAIPLSLQESWDNSGLQTGSSGNELKSALLAIDITEDVVNEAITIGCGLIISHHPLIFSPLKKISDDSETGRIIINAIRNNIAIYTAHTNLDVLNQGVSRKMAEKLQLGDVKVLLPLKDKLMKLVTWVPTAQLDKVRSAVFSAGAGVIGNYDSCSFNVTGLGTFRGNEKANPWVGARGKIHQEEEVRFETILLSHNKKEVLGALIAAHPYEEVAYDLYPLENEYHGAGPGCIGDLPEAIDEGAFLRLLSETFGAKGIRYSALTGKKVRKVALCGGAGIYLLKEAINNGADAFVTGDVKYHQFFNAAGEILIADIGHYESEKFTTEIIHDLIIKKFPTFALRFSEINTNPINYL